MNASSISRLLSQNGERPVSSDSRREGIIVKRSGDRVRVAALILNDRLAAERVDSCERILRAAGYAVERVERDALYVELG